MKKLHCTLRHSKSFCVRRRQRAGGAVLPQRGPPAVLHPCLHEGYNETYRRLEMHVARGSPHEVTLLGRCGSVEFTCGFEALQRSHLAF